MSDGHRTDPELIRALATLAEDVAFPQTPALAGVAERLRSERASRVRHPLPGLALWSRRRLLIGLAIVVLAALVVAAAARLGIGAISVEVQPGAKSVPSLPTVEPAQLGTPTTLEEAERTAGFRIGLPDGPPPDEVYAVEGPFGGTGIVVAWQPGGQYPTIDGTKWSLVLMTFRGDAEIAVKIVNRFDALHEVTVGGRHAYWIAAPHEISFETADGTRGPYRVLGNVLIWEAADGVTYRMETALDRTDAIALAGTIS